jgi:hypothetical protein
VNDRPAPLVPSECTMTGNDWFPFYFDRVRKSKWWRRASDVARSRNVMMWGEAFKASPAGSLPDDDDELAEAAGYGMDVEAFMAVKADIMSPWTLCADGRWYHPTVCEVVLEAWDRASTRKKTAAERQRRHREKVRGVTPERQDVTPQIGGVTRDEAEVTRHLGIQTRQTEQLSEANASSSSEDLEKQEYPPAFEIGWKAYPHVKGRSSKPKAHGYWRRLSPAHRAALPSAIARYARDGREPKNECGAPAMERWLRDGRYLDWMAEDQPPSAAWSGPPDVLAIMERAFPGKGSGYLSAYCVWQDVPTRALICSNEFMRKRISEEAGRALEAIGVKVLQARAA